MVIGIGTHTATVWQQQQTLQQKQWNNRGKLLHLTTNAVGRAGGKIKLKLMSSIGVWYVISGA